MTAKLAPADLLKIAGWVRAAWEDGQHQGFNNA